MIYHSKTHTMKKKQLVTALGKGHRLAYLEQNPHGYAAVRKVHKSKKAYDRRKGKRVHIE